MAVKKNERVLCGDASRHFDLFYKNPEKSLTNSDRSDIIIKLTTSAHQQNICGSAGTGRQARLRGVCFTTYGFKSRLPHK